MQQRNLFKYFFTKNRLIVKKIPRAATVFHAVCVAIVLAIGTIGTGFTKDEPKEKVKLDTVVKDFTLKDAEGKDSALYKLSEEKPATVILFLATQCPGVTAYAERIVRLVNAYDEKNVQFIGINSNKQEKVKEILAYHKKHGLEFPVLKDPENKIADYFGARRTPEVFLLDAEHRLRYAGAIDNNPKAPTKHYLKNALELVIAGKDIPKAAKRTRAIGCTIKRVRKMGVNDRTP